MHEPADHECTVAGTKLPSPKSSNPLKKPPQIKVPAAGHGFAEQWTCEGRGVSCLFSASAAEGDDGRRGSAELWVEDLPREPNTPQLRKLPQTVGALILGLKVYSLIMGYWVLILWVVFRTLGTRITLPQSESGRPKALVFRAPRAYGGKAWRYITRKLASSLYSRPFACSTYYLL